MLFSGSESNSQHRFSVLPFGGVALLTLGLLLAGCSGSPPPKSGPVMGYEHTLYVLNGNPPYQVTGFASNGTGASAPVSTLTLPTNFAPQAMTTDSTGQIYVAGIQNQSPFEILVYAAGSTGAAAPARTILTGQTDEAGSIAVDTTGQLYVADDLQGAVNVYAATANGAATPVRTIQWDPSTFRAGIDLAVDGTGALYVLGYVEGTVAGLVNPGEILVYGPGASGAATPVRTLVGSNVLFGLNQASIAVDAAGDLYAIVANPAKPFLNATEIVELAPGANGNPTPSRTLVGNFGLSGASATHLQIDDAGDVYVVGQFVNMDLPQTPIPFPPFIAAFGPSATGAVNPVNQFTAAAFEDGAFGFAVH